MKLKDRVAIVTGASRGIGKAIARAFAREGAVVVIAARSTVESKLISGTIQKTADEICAAGGQAFAIKADVAKEQSVTALVEQTLATFKRIDILVNNAATNRPAQFKDIPLTQWNTILKVNMGGAVICTRAVLPAMIEQRQGQIINISSIVTLKTHHEPFTGLAYDVSKAALNRFTIGLAEELKEYHIAVNALLPDNTETEGWSYLNPKVDKSGWKNPDVWGSYAVLVATRNPAQFTGRLLTEADIQKEFHLEDEL
jgi:NAD(P)-dependent dehydrogenase (short-subunit alcohol dehydrogenase family)